MPAPCSTHARRAMGHVLAYDGLSCPSNRARRTRLSVGPPYRPLPWNWPAIYNGFFNNS